MTCIWARLGKVKHRSIVDRIRCLSKQEQLLIEKTLDVEAEDVQLKTVEDALTTSSENLINDLRELMQML